MPELFLTGGRILTITEEQSMTVAKAMMLLPEWKQLKIGDTIFRLDEIDPEAKRLSKLPKQEKFDIRVPVRDVENSRRKSKKSLDKTSWA